MLASRHAYEHDGYGDFVDRLDKGRKLKGDLCKLYGIHNVVWVQRNGMPSQTIMSSDPQKTESATQEDLTNLVNRL